jgi:hypothetical protein
MPVGSGHDERQRDTTLVHQQMTLAAIFFPDTSGLDLRLPALAGFHRCPVDTLPAPGNPLKLVVLG